MNLVLIAFLSGLPFGAFALAVGIAVRRWWLRRRLAAAQKEWRSTTLFFRP